MIKTFDNFLADPEGVKQSALRAGFGTWAPNKTGLGPDFYAGMSFWGDHGTLIKALHENLGAIIPSSMFFRVTNPTMEKGLIHSDSHNGQNTAIVYLSPEKTERSGTAFYRHRETGLTSMPPLSELSRDEEFFKSFTQQLVDASENDWEEVEFIEAKYNRCLVFSASKMHCRIPRIGFGIDETDSRMVWVCHFDRVN
jgi:Family of unknown function (DUF6445)